MRSCNGGWIILVAAVTVCACLGCRGGSTPDEIKPSGTPTGSQPAPETPTKVESTAEKPPAEEPPPPPKMPEVHLPEALADTCLVGVDDGMPDGELSDLAGQRQPLSKLRGEKLTLVFFWTRGDSEFSVLAAQMALEDLQKDVCEPYAEKGVQVIAVNEGDAPEEIKKVVDQAGITFPSLLDPDGALFAQVAKAGLPRPYLLDADGKILWFDLEFSRITHDDLLQAIQVALGQTASK